MNLPTSEPRMRGVFPILVTPFDELGRVDADSLRRLVDFQLEAGVHGLGLALGSEITKLTEAERTLIARTVVEQVERRVPVVVNTGAPSAQLALHYARSAADAGADALMMTPPGGGADVDAFFETVSAELPVPIFIQDTGQAHVSAEKAKELAERFEPVQYVKVECPPTPVHVLEMVRQAGEVLTVFGGGGGTYLIEELNRGSKGTMPGCSDPAAFVAVWDSFRRGDLVAAQADFYQRILPVNRLAAQSWGAFYHVHKEILRRRGIIKTAKVRGPMRALDAATRQELDALIDALFSET
jgi:4-hydroxy-tetrahydrodipicolinate synthase